MAQNTSEAIKITHYINPHMFWFKYESSFLGDDPLHGFENGIQTFINSQKEMMQKKYTPERGEKVLVMNASWNKWVRAQVDEIIELREETKYIVWAIDHGVPFSVTSKWIRNLPQNLANVEMNSVHYGGLANIIPAETSYDFEQSELVQAIVDSWSPCSIRTVGDLLFDTASVNFTPELVIGKHYFGSIEVLTHSGKKEQVTLLLMKMNQAIESNSFISDLKTISTLRVNRWQNFDGYISKATLQGLKPHIDDTKCKRTLKNNFDQQVMMKVKDWEVRNENYQIMYDEDLDDSASTVKVVPPKLVDNFSTQAKVEAKIMTPSSSSLTHAKLEDLNSESCFALGLKNRDLHNLPRLPNTNDELKKLQKFETFEISENNSPIKSQNLSNQSNVLTDGGGKDDSPNSNPRRSILPSSSSSSAASIPSNVPKNFLEQMRARKKIAAAHAKKAEKNEMPKMIPVGYQLNDLQSLKSSNSQNSQKEKGLSNKQYLPAKSQTKTTKIEHKPVNSSTKQNFGFSKIVDNENCTSSIISDAHRVLVHGSRVPRPIENINHANFCDEVHNELQAMRLSDIYRIQSYAWPHIMRGNSLVIVNSAKTGKTLSYIPAICSLVKNYSVEVERQGVGPMAIIICTSAVEVEKSAKLCKRLLSTCLPKINVTQAYGIRDKSKIQSYLLNGCEILVTTTLCLSRLLNDSMDLFDRNRLQHLIVDNFNMIIERCRNELGIIFKKLCSVKDDKIQIVITSRAWHSSLPSFFKFCNNPILCIGAYIEAAVYARSEIKLKLTEKKDKAKHVIAYLQKLNYLDEPTLIICNKEAEATEISQILKAHAMLHITYHNYSDISIISMAKECYTHKPYQIVVCTDKTLFDLDIQNIRNIIHFSLSETWSNFTYRFSASFKCYPNYFQQEKSIEIARSIVLLDEDNNEQLPRLIDFLDYHGTKIPSHIKALAQSFQRKLIQNEEGKLRSFCPHILSIGMCPLHNECRHLHFLTKNNRSNDNIPRNGKIKLQVINVMSPTHFAARLLEHKPISSNNWTKLNKSDEYLQFSLSFSSYFTDSNNHQSYSSGNIGDLCVILEGISFHRCRIEDIEKKKQTSLTYQVKIQLIDIGKSFWCKNTELFYLPPIFGDFPGQAVDIRIAGIVPYDLEYDWDSKVLKNVKVWMEEHVNEKIHIEADIEISLMNCIWVNTLLLVEELPSISSKVNIISIKETLVKKKFGVAIDSTLTLLKDLAKDVDILDETPHIMLNESTDNKCNIENSLSESTNTSCNSSLNETDNGIGGSDSSSISTPKFEKNVNEFWAKLEDNKLQRVFISCFYNPSIFYVQNAAFFQRLQHLYEEIDIYISAAAKSNLTTNINVGDTCLAKENNKYNRAKVLKIYGNDEEIFADVLFVDLGIERRILMQHIIPITNKLLHMVPFQAIKCSLIGIKPNNLKNTWDNNISDKIFDDILDRCTNLFVKPVKETTIKNDDNILKFHSYNVILIDCSTEDDIVLNEKISNENLAKFDYNTKYLLDSFIDDGTLWSTSSDEHMDSKSVYSYTDGSLERAKSSTDVPDFMPDMSDICIDFTEEELQNLLTMPVSVKKESHEPKNEKVVNAKCTNSFDDLSRNKSLTGDVIINNMNSGNLDDDVQIPLLNFPTKIPDITWKQSDYGIYIKICAPDISKYALKVTSRTLHFSGIINNEMKSVFLNLFGRVDNKYISHQICGLYVQIRLVKCCKGKCYNWRRLVSETDCYNWLKYNVDGLEEEKIRSVVLDTHPRGNKTRNYYSSGDECDDASDVMGEYDNLDPIKDDFD